MSLKCRKRFIQCSRGYHFFIYPGRNRVRDTESGYLSPRRDRTEPDPRPGYVVCSRRYCAGAGGRDSLRTRHRFRLCCPYPRRCSRPVFTAGSLAVCIHGDLHRRWNWPDLSGHHDGHKQEQAPSGFHVRHDPQNGRSTGREVFTNLLNRKWRSLPRIPAPVHRSRLEPRRLTFLFSRVRLSLHRHDLVHVHRRQRIGHRRPFADDNDPAGVRLFHRYSVRRARHQRPAGASLNRAPRRGGPVACRGAAIVRQRGILPGPGMPGKGTGDGNGRVRTEPR